MWMSEVRKVSLYEVTKELRMSCETLLLILIEMVWGVVPLLRGGWNAIRPWSLMSHCNARGDIKQRLSQTSIAIMKHDHKFISPKYQTANMDGGDH